MPRDDSGMSVLKRLFSFSLGVWISAIVSFLTVPIMTRLVDPEEFGKATMYLAMYSLLLNVCLLATPSAYMRFFYQKVEAERSTLFWSSLVPSLVVWFGFSLVMLFLREEIGRFLVDQPNSFLTIVLAIALLLGVLQTFNQTVIRIRNEGFKYSLLQVVSSLSYLMFAVACAYLSWRNYRVFVYAHLFSILITLAVGVSMARGYWLPVKFDTTLVKEILAYGLPLLFASLMWWLLNWTDRLVLRMYADFTSIGLYAAAFKMAQLMGIFTSGFSNFWYPFAYEQFEKNPQNRDLFPKALDYAAFIMFSLGLTVTAGKDLIFLLFGKSYRTASQISPFLMLLPIMTTLCVIAGRGIDFSKKTYWGILIDGIVVTFNFIANLIIVPILGAKGAALTTGLSFIIFFSIESTVSVRLYPVNYNFVKIYLSVTVFVINAFINSFVESMILGVLSSCIAIVITAYIYRQIFRKVIFLIKQVFGLGSH